MHHWNDLFPMFWVLGVLGQIRRLTSLRLAALLIDSCGPELLVIQALGVATFYTLALGKSCTLSLFLNGCGREGRRWPGYLHHLFRWKLVSYGLILLFLSHNDLYDYERSDCLHSVCRYVSCGKLIDNCNNKRPFLQEHKLASLVPSSPAVRALLPFLLTA